MDLKAFVAGESPYVEGRGFAGIAQRASDKPVIAAIEGFAVAGGLEVALACDLIVAAKGAKLGIPEAKRSLVAAGGALLRLPRRIPYHVAMELALTGDPIPAERGAELGLVNRVAEPGGALDAALELADDDRQERPAGADRLQAHPGRGARLERGREVAEAGRDLRAGVRLGGRARGRHGVRRETGAAMEGSLKGQLLIAAPQLSDYFRRTVVLVLEHTEEGAMGVVLNRPTETAVAEAVPDLAELAGDDALVHAGGPVDPKRCWRSATWTASPSCSRPRTPTTWSCAACGCSPATPAGRPASSTASSRRRRGSPRRPRPTTPSPRATSGPRCCSARAAATR